MKTGRYRRGQIKSSDLRRSVTQRCVINSTLDTLVQLQVIVSLLQGPTTLLGRINNSQLASLRSQGRCSEADYISK